MERPSSSSIDPPSSLLYDPSAAEREERPKVLLPAILLALTCLTTVLAGFFLHLNFVSRTSAEFDARLGRVFSQPLDLLDGIPFALTILVILLAHEMGHYLACRYYRIRATLPFVIPAPPPIVPFGTLGAVIRIKSLFRDRRQLFDVGIAGPLAGFVFILPAVAVGLLLSKEFEGSMAGEPILQFGEPLLFQAAARLFFEGEGLNLNLHPVGWAAWFGMLATSLNLLPVGQLDGGHIVYALFGARAHRIVSYVTFVSLVLLSLLSWPMLGYLLFALLLLFMRFRHPEPYRQVEGLGRGRVWLAVAGLIVFILTFIPIPVQLVESAGL